MSFGYFLTSGAPLVVGAADESKVRRTDPCDRKELFPINPPDPGRNHRSRQTKLEPAKLFGSKTKSAMRIQNDPVCFREPCVDNASGDRISIRCGVISIE